MVSSQAASQQGTAASARESSLSLLLGSLLHMGHLVHLDPSEPAHSVVGGVQLGVLAVWCQAGGLPSLSLTLPISKTADKPQPGCYGKILWSEGTMEGDGKQLSFGAAPAHPRGSPSHFVRVKGQAS